MNPENFVLILTVFDSEKSFLGWVCTNQMNLISFSIVWKMLQYKTLMTAIYATIPAEQKMMMKKFFRLFSYPKADQCDCKSLIPGMCLLKFLRPRFVNKSLNC